MSISRGGIIILDFKYRVGDLVEVRVPDLLLLSGSISDTTRLTLPGIILKSNLKYMRFATDFKWEEEFWRELAQRQMMSYTTLLRDRMLDITEYNIVRLINRTGM